MSNFFKKPSMNFGEVRDGRRSMPLWLDIDLSTQRRISDGSALSVNIAGNSFYIDADTSTVGFGRVHFQDTNLDNVSAPFFVSPGFIANVPFTQILVENEIQAGKRLRIFYGVDIDFQAGVNTSVSLSGIVEVTDSQVTEVLNGDAAFGAVQATGASGVYSAAGVFPWSNYGAMESDFAVEKVTISNTNGTGSTYSLLVGGRLAANYTFVGGKRMKRFYTEANASINIAAVYAATGTTNIAPSFNSANIAHCQLLAYSNYTFELKRPFVIRKSEFDLANEVSNGVIVVSHTANHPFLMSVEGHFI